MLTTGCARRSPQHIHVSGETNYMALKTDEELYNRH